MALGVSNYNCKALCYKNECLIILDYTMLWSFKISISVKLKTPVVCRNHFQVSKPLVNVGKQ